MPFLIFILGLYFLPAIIAAVRQTHNSTAILLLNLFLGWTVVGWMVAFLMSICSAPWYAYNHPPFCHRGY